MQEKYDLRLTERDRCHYCGKPCEDFAANPGLWPVYLCGRDDPAGTVRAHCAQCVMDRLDGHEERMRRFEAGPAPDPSPPFVLGMLVGLAMACAAALGCWWMSGAK